MNKKNTGATLGVLVAVSVGATAYASAMNNLDGETYAKTLLENKVSYVVPENKAKIDTAKADYTEDLKNTNIGESKQEVAVSQKEETATLYQALNVAEKEVEEEDEEATEEVKDAEAEETVSEETPVVEEETDSVKEDEEASQSQEDFQNETYLTNTAVEAEEEKEEETPAEEVVNTYAEKFVGVEYLNVRKEASKDSQILTTIKAGDKVTGNVEGEWLKTDLGYINLSFLQDTYPQALVDQIAAKKAEAERKAQEEAQRKAEAEKKAQEEAQRKAEAEKKAQEEAQRKAEAEKKAQEEAQRKAEAEKKAQEEAKKNQAVAYTGWVNTSGLNIRNQASTNGRILGNLTKGDKVSGTAQNGWVKFNFNGQEAYVSGSYLVNYEVKKEAPVRAETQQRPAVANGSGQAAASIAQQFAGYPYVFGASDPAKGFDCSGLVHYAYRQIGVNLARNSSAQFSNGYAVDANNLVPGDLVFFSYGGSIDHVGIITGYDGTFIHASTPGTGVVYGNVYSSHYQSVFRGARRIF